MPPSKWFVISSTIESHGSHSFLCSWYLPFESLSEMTVEEMVGCDRGSSCSRVALGHPLLCHPVEERYN